VPAEGAVGAVSNARRLQADLRVDHGLAVGTDDAAGDAADAARRIGHDHAHRIGATLHAAYGRHSQADPLMSFQLARPRLSRYPAPSRDAEDAA
jgi:hypothetical protein